MNQELFKLLSSFVVRTRKVTGPVDPTKLVADADYASHIFKKIDEEGDDDLVILAMGLRQAITDLSDTEPGATKHAVIKVANKNLDNKKYYFDTPS